MSNYYTLKSSKGNHMIVENKTKHIVFETNNKRKAHKKLVFYNMGGGFTAWKKIIVEDRQRVTDKLNVPVSSKKSNL